MKWFVRSVITKVLFLQLFWLDSSSGSTDRRSGSDSSSRPDLYASKSPNTPRGNYRNYPVTHNMVWVEINAVNALTRS